MSFIVKGIDLPRGTEGMSITFYTKDGWREAHILDVDQAIQIPKGHGRLIDGDKIMKDLEEWKLNPNNDDEAVVFVNHFQGIIRTEPTILDEERE